MGDRISVPVQNKDEEDYPEVHIKCKHGNVEIWCEVCRKEEKEEELQKACDDSDEYIAYCEMMRDFGDERYA